MPNWCQNKISIEANVAQLDNIHHFIVDDNNIIDFGVILPIPKELYGVAQFSILSKQPYLVNTNPDSVGYKRMKDVDALKVLMLDNSITKDVELDINDTLFANFHKLVAAMDKDIWTGMSTELMLNGWKKRIPQALGLIIRTLQDDHALWCIQQFSADNPRSFALHNWGVKGNAETGITRRRLPKDTGDTIGRLNYNFATAWNAPLYWFEQLCKDIHDADPTARVKLEYGEPGHLFGGVRENDDEGGLISREMTSEELDSFLFGE